MAKSREGNPVRVGDGHAAVIGYETCQIHYPSTLRQAQGSGWEGARRPEVPGRLQAVVGRSESQKTCLNALHDRSSMEGREGYGKKKPGLSSEDRVFLFPACRQGSIRILSMSGTFEKYGHPILSLYSSLSFSFSSVSYSASIRFKDEVGREVTFPFPPKRIVSLAPNITEILFSLGLDEEIVGVSIHCNFPEKAKSKVSGGKLYQYRF